MLLREPGGALHREATTHGGRLFSRRLRLTDAERRDGARVIDLLLEIDGRPHAKATARCEFRLDGQDREDIRWYLEEFRQYLQAPAPIIAGKVSELIATRGVELFECLFESSPEVREIWQAVSSDLETTRIEIVDHAGQDGIIPWEFLRERAGSDPVALLTHSFVRS